MKTTLLHYLIIVAVAGLVFFTRLGATDLWDEDEAFFAATAAEMERRGEWIVPWYNGEVFSHKPPMMYWMMRIGYLLWGENELGARFFSALFGTGAALLTYQIGRRLFDVQTALLAGLAMSSCVMFAVVSRAATADSYLVFFVTLTLWVYLRVTPCFAVPCNQTTASNDGGATTSDNFAGIVPSRWLAWAAIYAVMGLAVLVKGPIGVLLPGMTMGLFLLLRCPIAVVDDANARSWQRALTWFWQRFSPRRVLAGIWVMRPFTAMLMVVLIAGPWFLLVGLRTGGEFLAEFFGTHNYGRFMSAMENHRGPIVYYIPAALVGFFPWSCFVLPTIGQLIQQVRRGASQHPAWLFVACWAMTVVGFFSLAGTKLPSYILPAYPAFALATAAYLKQWLSAPERHWRHWPAMAYGSLLFVGVAVAGAIVGLTSLTVDGRPVIARLGVNEVVASSIAQLWWLGMPLVTFGCIAWTLQQRGRLRASVMVFSCCCPIFVGSLLIVAAERINPHQTSRQVTEFIEAGDRHAPIAEYSMCLPSLVYYADRPLTPLDSANDVEAFFRSHPTGSLVTTDSGWDRLSRDIDGTAHIVRQIPRFPRPGSVLVIQAQGTHANQELAGRLEQLTER